MDFLSKGASSLGVGRLVFLCAHLALRAVLRYRILYDKNIGIVLNFLSIDAAAAASVNYSYL
jgi:hypothetical protein